MFRNLARRNQSLLQRQLSVLDDMERRATDPDVLEDLFKMDHLTTRMRRHAEGLIILSGAPPGRSWSAPVKLVDVMRGAVAEVEDYARVTVSTQSRAALAGSAVTDVIHLLAELIENATSLSPPFTQVRVSGEIVANGFVIEVEDRGLGMIPQRLYELNDRLANPPDINPANTEQLGLFVVGQLARRHGISVMLRPSPYGGTTAVALLPLVLIVEEGPAAITAGGPATAGSRGTGPFGTGPYATGPYGNGSYGNGSQGVGAASSREGASRTGGFGAVGVPATPTAGSTWPGADGWSSDHGRADQAGAGYPDSTGSTIRISGPLRHPGTTGGFRAPGGTAAGAGPTAGSAGESGTRRGRHGTDDVPVVTGVPVTRPTRAPVPPFDVFTPIRRAEQDGDPGSAFENTGAFGNTGDGDGGYAEGDSPGSGGDIEGLPRRVRQASLAPQLRASAAAAPHGPIVVPPAAGASLADMRNTLSAMQRGWQQGRSQTRRDTEGRVDGS
jgi:hypothetical protein